MLEPPRTISFMTSIQYFTVLVAILEHFSKFTIKVDQYKHISVLSMYMSYMSMCVKSLWRARGV